MSIDAILRTRILDPKTEERSAKEMFEDNGYVYKEDEDTITYTRTKTNYTNKIIFDKNNTSFLALQEKDGQISPYNIRMSILAAIRKQCKELNWHVGQNQ